MLQLFRFISCADGRQPVSWSTLLQHKVCAWLQLVVLVIGDPVYWYSMTQSSSLAGPHRSRYWWYSLLVLNDQPTEHLYCLHIEINQAYVAGPTFGQLRCWLLTIGQPCSQPIVICWLGWKYTVAFKHAKVVSAKSQGKT